MQERQIEMSPTLLIVHDILWNIGFYVLQGLDHPNDKYTNTLYFQDDHDTTKQVFAKKIIWNWCTSHFPWQRS